MAEMRRSLRPSAYARMITNEFVSSESRFVDLAAWDACVQPALVPVVQDKGVAVWVGLDGPAADLCWCRRLDQARQHRAGGRDL